MPRGEDILSLLVIVACVVFIGWWPYHCLKVEVQKREPQEEECPRCGRMVEHIDLHTRYCKGQIARRNPLSGKLSTVHRSFQRGENVDVVGKDAKDDELEQL